MEAALDAAEATLAPEAALRSLDEMEQEHIASTLDQTEWNISAAARSLGMSRPTLRKRMARYGLKRPV